MLPFQELLVTPGSLQGDSGWVWRRRGMLGAWEGTERTLTQGPYTFCSPQRVLPTMRTCPLFPAPHTHKCAQEAYSEVLSFLWGMRSRPLGDSILASWALVCEPHAGASSINASPGLRQEPQGPAHGRSPRPASQAQGSLGWPLGGSQACQGPTSGRWGGGRGGWPRPARTRGLCAHWGQTSAPPHDALGPRPPGAPGPLHR